MMPRLHTVRSVAKRLVSKAEKTPSASPPMEELPVLLLIHGLDSSSATWKATTSSLLMMMSSEKSSSSSSSCDDDSLFREIIAMDCRGCGQSEMGKEEDFSLDSLVEDVRRCLDDEVDGTAKPSKVVLLGHSMGARIALSFAASYPERISCLLMEDMDIARRPTTNAPFQVIHDDEIGVSSLFDRLFRSKEEAIQGLASAGYPIDRIEKWIEQGRIYQREAADGGSTTTWWSEVNPDFRRLCYKFVVDNELGERDCQRVASNQDFGFPIHALVAGEDGTICDEASLDRMQQVLGNRLTIHRFPEATHSIHSSQPEEYLEVVKKILEDCR